jgi:hypothetical protein
MRYHTVSKVRNEIIYTNAIIFNGHKNVHTGSEFAQSINEIPVVSIRNIYRPDP